MLAFFSSGGHHSAAEPYRLIAQRAHVARLDRSRLAADPERKAIALAGLFHLVADAHQPLHTTQLFSREYPQGDRGGNEMCIHVVADRTPLSLHLLWDGLLTSSRNVRALWKMATELRTRSPKTAFPDLWIIEPEAWAEGKL